MGKKWLPLESNPEVLNDFVSKLGYDTTKYSFCDVFGLDEVSLKNNQAQAPQAFRVVYHGLCAVRITVNYLHPLAGTVANGTSARCGCLVSVPGNKRVRGSKGNR